MADAQDYERLARQHMRRQVREAAAVQVALGRYWDRIVDPNDFDRTFRLFRETAIPLIDAGRVKSSTTSDEYYRALLAVDDLPEGPALPLDRRPVEATRASIGAAAKSYYTDYRIRQGDDPGPLVDAAKLAALRSAKRMVLNAGRERLLERQTRDPNVRGWARVSDGSPCGFCAMLVSRGPVYDAGTVRFEAHDGCGCGVRLVTYADPSGGWDADSRFWKTLYDEGGLVPTTNRTKGNKRIHTTRVSIDLDVVAQLAAERGLVRPSALT